MCLRIVGSSYHRLFALNPGAPLQLDGSCALATCRGFLGWVVLYSIAHVGLIRAVLYTIVDCGNRYCLYKRQLGGSYGVHWFVRFHVAPLQLERNCTLATCRGFLGWVVLYSIAQMGLSSAPYTSVDCGNHCLYKRQ